MNETGATIQVTANGRAYTAGAGLTLADFVRARGLEPGMVVVERNGEAVTPSSVNSIRLADGDRLEIVRVVAGG